MLWLPYFAVIGIVGVAQGNILCYYQALAASCKMKDACDDELASCIPRVARQCGIENDKDIKSTVSFLEEMCRDGSELNIKYRRHLPCIESAKSPRCIEGMVEAISKVQRQFTQPENLMKELVKVGCRFMDELSSCNAQKIREKCGSEAQSWYKQQENAGGNQLSQRACVELNGAGINSSHLFICLLQAAILTIKWFFY